MRQGTARSAADIEQCFTADTAAKGRSRPKRTPRFGLRCYPGVTHNQHSWHLAVEATDPSGAFKLGAVPVNINTPDFTLPGNYIAALNADLAGSTKLSLNLIGYGGTPPGFGGTFNNFTLHITQ